MKLLTLFLTGVSAHRRLSWSIRAVLSVVASLVLAFQPFFYLTPAAFKPPTDPLAALTRPVEMARYAASLVSPGLALAQGGVITKTAPAITAPGDPLAYPIFIEKTALGDWLTGTIVITDPVPANTGSPSGAPEPGWNYSFSGGAGRFQNIGLIIGTGVISVGKFNIIVNSPLGNGTIISNTAYLSTTTGIDASPLVTTTVQTSDFSLVKYASSSPVCAGSFLTYTIAVSNINPTPLVPMPVPYTATDKLPAQVSLVYASNTPVTAADTITWTMSNPVLETLWSAGYNTVTRTAVVSVPFSLANGVTLTNQITLIHATVLTAFFSLPVTVTKLSPDFTFQSPLAYGMTAVFTNTTIGDASFGWDFGDGAGSTAISPTHFYTGSGVFNVTLTATSAHGCGVLQVTHPITVVQPATVTVTANPTTTYANGISSTLVTAVVSDTTGLAVPGIPLTFTTNLGNWVGDGQTMVLYTNGAGIATRTITSTVIGTAFITVTAPNGITGTAQVIFDLPRLALSKTDSPDPVNAGALLTYTLVYSNLSSVPANSVWLTDTLPLSVTLNASAPPTTTQSGNQASWNLGSLPPFSSSQIMLTVTVATPIISGTILTNTALITAPGVISTATALVTTTVQSSHTLVIAKSESFDPIPAGNLLVYTMNYTITGNEPAPNAVVTDTLPANTSFSAASGGITPVGGVLTWTLGTRYPPTTGVLTCAVLVNSPLPNNTVLTNTVRFFDGLGQVANHTITTTVVSSHTLRLVKSDAPYDPVDAGGWLTYTLAYSNTGNEAALSAQITDTVPANTTFGACAGCASGGGVVTWTLPTLNPNAAGVLTLTVLVTSPLANGTIITNTARLYDTNAGLPAASTITTTVRSTHTLLLLKSAALAVVPAGQTLTYTLAYTVTGNETAQSVTITDTVPANTGYITCVGAGCGESGGVVTWPLGDLNPGQTGLLTLVVSVTMPLANGTIITNTARLFDANAGAPVASTVTTTVASSHTLTLLKTVTPTLVPAGQLLNYSLAYTVTGNEPAVSAVITDAIPANTGSAACAGCTIGGGVVTWTLPVPLLPGDSGVLTFTVAVTSPLPNATIITNTGRLVDANGGLPVSSTVTATVQSRTVITFTKSAIPPSGSQVTPGQVITYILTAANSGNQMATGAVFTDWVPVETTIITYTASKAPAPVRVARRLSWAIGTLTTGERVTATIRVSVTTPLTRGLVIANQGYLLTAQTGLSTTNFVTHTVISTPTLTLRKTADPASGTPVFPGNLITYTLTVSNTGSGPATTFRLTDTVPISVNLVPGVSVSPGFGLNIAGGDVIITGSLGAGQALTATFGVTVALSGLAQGDILSNTALVSYAESPVITQTNTVTHPVRLTPALTLTKLAQPPGPTIPAGAAITYTVIVTNNDAYMSTGIVLTDFIPTYTTYVPGSLSSSQGLPTGPDPVVVPVGSLAGSQVMSFTFRVTVNSPITNGLVITNTAQMNADYLGAVESNQVTHTIVATPQLSLVKSNIPTDTVTPGNLINYHLVLSNTGAGSATNVVITDTLPPYVTVAGGPLAVPTNVTSTITGSQWVSIAPVVPGGGGTVDLYIFLRVTRPLTNGLVLTNTATYGSDQTPLSQSNAVTNTVSSQPVLLITKLANPLPGPVHPGDPITYTIRVEHDPTFSTENAPNVVITDTLPVHTNYVAGSVGLVGGVNPTANFVAGAALGHSDLLPLGEVMTLTYVVTVTRPLPNGTLIANVAWVDSDRTTPNISSYIFHTVASQAVLTYTKSAQPPAGPISPGQTITYTLTFTNTGDADATGLVITDVAPTYTTYVTNSAHSTGLFGYNTGVITFSGMVSGVNGVFTATFAARLPAVLTNGLTILNAARFTTVETGVVSQTNSVTHTVVSAPLLRLQKFASPPHGTAVSPGAAITYTLILTNSGTDNASGVVITDTFDPNAQAALNPQMWTVGTLLAGRAVSYTVMVTVTSPLTNGVIISNTARVTAAGVFTVSNAVTHTVVGQPNLIIYKTAIPASGTYIDPGAVLAYYVNLRNTGNAPATHVILTDTLPISTSLLPPPPFPMVIPLGSVSGSNPLVATIPTIPADGSLVQFSFVVSVSSAAMPGLVVTNAAQITSNETPLTTTNVTTHPVKAPDLALTKLANPPAGTPVQPGGFITYTLIVTNNGPAAANGVVITDTISPAGAVGGVNPRIFNAGTLFSYQSISYTLRVTVTNGLTAGLVISNVAQARSTDTAVVTTPEVTHPVAAVPNLTITKSATPPARSSLGANRPITYTISVVNTGNTTATTLLLTDTLPFSVNLVTATLSSGGPVNGSNPLTASVTTLAASQRLTLTIVVTTSAVTTNTLITNTAQVIANAVPLRTSLPVTHIITATLVPNLVLSKTAIPASGGLVSPGQIITYNLTLMNNGLAGASGVVITDSFDPNVQAALNPLVWNVGVITAGATLNYTAQVTVTSPLTNGTVITNIAQITANGLPAAASNPVTHTVTSAPNLLITKLANPAGGAPVLPGQLITYTIAVTNNGTDTARNLTLTDFLPGGVNYVAGSVSATPGFVVILTPPPTLALSGNLPAGAMMTATCQVTVTAAPGTVLTNTAQVTATNAVSRSAVVSHRVSLYSLVIGKTALPPAGVVAVGQVITYTVTVFNPGDPVTNVIISDTLDPNVSLLSVNSTVGTPGGSNPVQITGFGLNTGQGVTVTVRVQVSNAASGTVISNQAGVTSAQTSLYLSGVVTHVISVTGVVSPLLTIVKSATPPGGTTVTQNDVLTYSITAVNSGGPATGVVVTDVVPSGVSYVPGSAATTLGNITFDGTRVMVTVPTTFTAGAALTATFRVMVTTNQTTTLTNTATLDSDQTLPQNSTVIHPVRGVTTAGGGAVYLPIILKDFAASNTILQWDDTEPVRDRVRDLDGAAGICVSFPCDGRNDGVFKLFVNIGSEGSKVVTNIRLVSTQGVEWNTIPGDVRPILGVFNGPPLNNLADGSIYGVLFNAGQVQLHLFASDDASFSRFVPGQYIYTVIITFTDGSTVTAQTANF